MGPIRIIGVGSALVDLLYYVPDELLNTIRGGKGGTEQISPADLDTLLQRLPDTGRRMQGGSTANTLVALAHLGFPSAFVCRIGRDDAGVFFRRALAEAGVDTTCFKVDEQLPTGRCLSLITPDSERTMRTCLGADGAMGAEDVRREELFGATHLCVEGYSLRHPDLLARTAALAEELHVEVHFDLAAPEIVRENRDFLLDFIRRYVYALYANEREAQELSGEENPEKALAFLGRLCVLPIVKLGKRGVLIGQQDGTVLRVPAKKVQAIDTTAAGDLWAAGFLRGYLDGWPLEKAARLGAAVSAEVVQVTGSVLPEPVWQRLRQEWLV
ncbi:MAG: adenosine kinase [Victivallales bacterium]|nr:adenosine kinase [Victivallales bacterium]